MLIASSNRAFLINSFNMVHEKEDYIISLITPTKEKKKSLVADG
jgi:hypothetical protein